ncbi:MAG TPA: hypothetical protein VGG25_02340 [Streptosporangiaceae bacterium]
MQFKAKGRLDMRSRRAGGTVTRTRVFRQLSAVAAALAVGVLGMAASAPALAVSRPRPQAGGPAQPRAGGTADYRRACALPTARRAECLALIRTNVAQHLQSAVHPDSAPTGVGYGPASLQAAYKLPSATAGAGRTVAIVDAYDDPDAAADLATYRAAWGLPACGAGCFSKVNQNGAAAPLPAAAGTSGWDREESLDLDMVSAICPLCHILLVEANSPAITDLGTGVNSAVTLGAKYVSNSYGAVDSTSDATYDTDYYIHEGVAVTASAGDNGYGLEYPATSQWITAVGGTTLSPASNSRGWTETAWSGTGSGCSTVETKPSFETDPCTHRTDNDVSAVADPATGVAVYDSYSLGGWAEAGGTSVASPIIAATYALAGIPAANNFAVSYLWGHPFSLYDVTSGSDGTCNPSYLCTAEAGYDGPTGWGTPNGTASFVTGQEWTPWLGEVSAPAPWGITPGSAPAVASWAKNRLDTFVWGADNSIWHVWWNGMVWSGWESQGNPGVAIASSPAAVSWGSSHIDLFAVGADGNLYQKTYNNAWGNWASPVPPPPPGVAPGSSPAVSSWAANRLDVFVRGTDNAIWHVWWNGITWSNWESLGPAIVSSPAAVSWGFNHIDLFGIGTDGNLYQKTWNGNAWSNWVSPIAPPPPGIAAGSSPAVSTWTANHLDVFVRGTDNAIWHTQWNGSNWSSWDSRGKTIVSSPASVSWGVYRIDLFGLGTDGNLYHQYYG